MSAQLGACWHGGALLDGADELAANPLRPGGRREWVDIGTWLYPGDRVLLMDDEQA